MNNGSAGPGRPYWLRPVPFSLILVGVTLCGCAGPPKREYVLGAPAFATTASRAQTALPVVQVERVQLSDYLDSRDILTRGDGEVVPSQTGRWAERLSVGVTRALTASLAGRLAGVAVTSGQPIEPPVLRILVDVIDFEATMNQHVVLAARWAVTDGSGRGSLIAEQASLIEPVAAPASDSAVVAAMSLALESLADRIAAGIGAAKVKGKMTSSGPGI
ncbi:MAG: membrane integrity-associated transporter subunit PqiC [Alphaproteobacteria bacterium]|nr:membrane integrity-associated transporter subunit PqiC [Alphaproteobacteria bacterium]